MTDDAHEPGCLLHPTHLGRCYIGPENDEDDGPIGEWPPPLELKDGK